MLYSNIGLASIYPWRPHPFHHSYIKKLAIAADKNIFELQCGGSLTRCYDKYYANSGFGSIDHCLKCRIGRDETGKYFTKINRINWAFASTPVDDEWAAISSNLSSLTRSDSLELMRSHPAKEGLIKSYRASFHSAVEWINDNNIDLVILFNGRIDILRGVMDAARFCGVDFASHERTWLGDGIRIIPFDNCLNISCVQAANKEVRVRGLSQEDRNKALSIVNKRVNRTGSNEWRDYQTKQSNIITETDKSIHSRLLILPSSPYEFYGHPEYRVEWNSNFEAIKSLKTKLGISDKDIIIRGHPVWSQNIGSADGKYMESLYRAFCRKHGITYIPSHSPIHTVNLIESSEVIALNGGSSIIEAIAKGKSVVSLAPSPYQFSNIVANYLCPSDDIKFPDKDVAFENLLYYVFAADQIVPTYSAFLKATSSIEQKEYEGGHFEDIELQVRKKTLVLDRKWIQKPGDPVKRDMSILQKARRFYKVGDR